MIVRNFRNGCVGLSGLFSFMVLSKRVGLVVLGAVLLLLAGLASALSLSSGADTVIVSGARADVTLWATSDLNTNGQMAFSAYAGDVNAFFDRPIVSVAPGETAAAHLIINAPDYFRGVKDVPVWVQLCALNNGTNCVVSSTTVRVVSYPYGDSTTPASTASSTSIQTSPYRTVQTNGFVDGFPNQNNLVIDSTPTYGVTASRVVRTQYADPTSRSVDVTGDLHVSTPATQGARVKVTVANTGAAGDYDFVLTGDDASRLHAVASVSGARLQTNQAVSFYVDAFPNPSLSSPSGGATGPASAGASRAGRYNVVLQVQNAGQLVEGGYAVIQVDVSDVHQATLVLGQSSLEVVQGSSGELPLSITNTGTASETLQLVTPNFISGPASIVVGAGQTRSATLVVDAAKLDVGSYQVEIGAQNAFVSGKGAFTLNVNPAPVVVPTVSPAAPTVQDVLTLEANVSNPSNATWFNVTAMLVGIPQNWTVTKAQAVSLAAGQSMSLQLVVNRTTDEEAPNPSLLILSDGVTVARQDLPKINSRTASGLTGLFTAGPNSFAVNFRTHRARHHWYFDGGARDGNGRRGNPGRRRVGRWRRERHCRRGEHGRGNAVLPGRVSALTRHANRRASGRRGARS